METIAIKPNLKSKWTLEISTRKNDTKMYSISDGWFVDYPIVYNDGKVVYDFPERIPKYVKRFIQKAIGSSDFLYIYK